MQARHASVRSSSGCNRALICSIPSERPEQVLVGHPCTVREQRPHRRDCERWHSAARKSHPGSSCSRPIASAAALHTTAKTASGTAGGEQSFPHAGRALVVADQFVPGPRPHGYACCRGRSGRSRRCQSDRSFARDGEEPVAAKRLYERFDVRGRNSIVMCPWRGTSSDSLEPHVPVICKPQFVAGAVLAPIGCEAVRNLHVMRVSRA
jgi:hypothetical protein